MNRFQAYRKMLFGLCVSIMIERFLSLFMGSVNVFMLGAYSDGAVAAVGVATQYISAGQILPMIASAGGSIVISQNLGAGKEEAANRASAAVLLLSLIVGGMVSIVCIAAPRLLLAPMGLEREILAEAAVYLRYVGGSLVLYGLFISMSAILRCYNFPRTLVYTIIVMNLLNVAGAYLVIYRPFEIPLYGVHGVAVVYLISVAACALLAILLLRVMRTRLHLASLKQVSLNMIANILKVGVPTSIENVSYSLSQIVTTGIIVSLGILTVSAKTYVANVVTYVCLLGMSFGMAAQIIVSRMLGAGEEETAYRFVHRNILINAGLNAGLALIVFLFRYQIFSLFTSNEQVVELAAGVLLVDIFVQIGRAFNHCYGNALKGAGDVRYPMVIMLLSTWVVCVPLSYVFSIWCGWGLVGIWIAFALDEWVRGLLSLHRWISGKWKNKLVVERPESEKNAALEHTPV